VSADEGDLGERDLQVWARVRIRFKVFCIPYR
jgi:hypothetical protein